MHAVFCKPSSSKLPSALSLTDVITLDSTLRFCTQSLFHIETIIILIRQKTGLSAQARGQTPRVATGRRAQSSPSCGFGSSEFEPRKIKKKKKKDKRQNKKLIMKIDKMQKFISNCMLYKKSKINPTTEFLKMGLITKGAHEKRKFVV